MAFKIVSFTLPMIILVYVMIALTWTVMVFMLNFQGMLLPVEVVWYQVLHCLLAHGPMI